MIGVVGHRAASSHQPLTKRKCTESFDSSPAQAFKRQPERIAECYPQQACLNAVYKVHVFYTCSQILGYRYGVFGSIDSLKLT